MTGRQEKKSQGSTIVFSIGRESVFSIPIGRESSIELQIFGGRIMPRVSLLGPPGTYTEEAATHMLRKDLRQDLALLDSNSAVVQQVENGESDMGILPLENSNVGYILENLGDLVSAKNVQIMGEIVIPIRHMLVGRDLKTARTVYSHEQALAQCKSRLQLLVPGYMPIRTDSTSAALEEVKADPYGLAIASKRAAELNGLPVLVEDIQDHYNNQTRFVLIGKGKTSSSGYDRTVLISKLSDHKTERKRDLFEVIGQNGFTIESANEYQGNFLMISVNGHIQNTGMTEVVAGIKRRSEYFKLLGSYKKVGTLEEFDFPYST